MQGYRALRVFCQFALTLLILTTVLASGVLFVAHDGPSVELAEALGLLAVFIGLLLITERLSTGRWHRWSRH
ncbi:hypothetical protein ACFVYG_20265 [Streptomyces sp. NPDC058256]|uniref:hypothetical protein n=1 Tax=Streptomyces sp. NPDC058256 TaxID=3346408 RepID=UPI0036E1B54B